MRFVKTSQLTAILLLLLICGAGLLDCHGDCAGDDHASPCHVCTCAVVSPQNAMGFDFDRQPLHLDDESHIPLNLAEDFFQPPRHMTRVA